MKKLLTILSLLALATLVAGCGEETDTTADTAAEATTETTDESAVEEAAETVTDAATDAVEAATEAVEALEDAVATANCDGGCGMTDVPTSQMTEIDGKFYCAGCAAKMQEEDHTGHDHG